MQIADSISWRMALSGGSRGLAVSSLWKAAAA